MQVQVGIYEGLGRLCRAEGVEKIIAFANAQIAERDACITELEAQVKGIEAMGYVWEKGEWVDLEDISYPDAPAAEKVNFEY